MCRFSHLALIVFAFLATSATDAFAHKVRVYNDSDVEVKVVIYHFSSPSTYWVIREIDTNDKSPIEDLKHGWRIVAVADAITDELLLVEKYKQGDNGTRIRIAGTSPDIRISLATVRGNADP
jgi:hypothetical protein